VVFGSVLVVAGAMGVVAALRPASLTVDDRGLRLRTFAGPRVIPWSLVRSFRIRPGYGG